MIKDAMSLTDHREFFRIDDELCFDYFIIPQNTSKEMLTEENIQERLFTEDEYRHYRLIRQLYEIDNESNRYLAEIARVQPEVSRYLECMHQKFSVLAESLYEKQAQKPRRLNLSVGGMAFQTSDAIAANTHLKIKIMFYPSGLGVIGTLNVLRCDHCPQKDAEKPYLICGQFTDLSSLDEQIIHQHVLQKQLYDNR